MSAPEYIRWFGELGIDDVPTVGGKNASLGEMYRELTSQGVRVPNGFAVTAQAYRDLIEAAGIRNDLFELLKPLSADASELADRARRVREAVYDIPLPAALREQILGAFHALRGEYGPELAVAVRSSATAEDLPTASFAGQHESFLNIRDEDVLLDMCRRCYASLFTDRAVTYRIDQGFDHMQVGLSIGIMKMVRSDLASSGVMFSLDTDSGFRDVVFITGAYGLGENVVQGTVDPDEFYVHKPTFDLGYRAVLKRSLGSKDIAMVYASAGSRVGTRNISTAPAQRARFCIDDQDVMTLADYAIKIERHYSAQARREKPMDIEWAKDGLDGLFYIVQARPETVASGVDRDTLKEYEIRGQAEARVTGRAVGSTISSGKVRVIDDAAELAQFCRGEVLVAETTAPDWGPFMRQASAVITNRGGRTCHAAIVARELGIPAVVGATGATTELATGDVVTVSCAEGSTGKVYRGAVDFDVIETDLSRLTRPATQVLVNLGNPDLAFKTAMMPNDGVGLARLEFIINEHVKAHPMALLHMDQVTNAGARRQLTALTRNYTSPAEYFVQTLAEGAGTIAGAFYPRPVIVRLSDFKSNEYANLPGGRDFEPIEANPMLGLRGAARYTHPAYAEAFALECAAMRRVREEMGLTNVKLMIPFCRTVDEGKRVLRAMAEHGLEQGSNGLEIYVMCEIPNNIVQVDAFSRLFDGFSIGSNDLTQLVLGVDRDSELVAMDFDERDPGVLEMIRLAITGAHRNGRHAGICGQAPSDYPEVTEFLVRNGIDSISLTPDTVLKTTMQLLQTEANSQPEVSQIEQGWSSRGFGALSSEAIDSDQ